MNSTSFNQIPFTEKKALVIAICAMHRALQVTQRPFTARLVTAPSELNDAVQPSVQPVYHKSVFASLIGLLSPIHREIIENEFLAEQRDPYWYRKQWTKSTYYRFKHEAIDQFLLLFFYV